MSRVARVEPTDPRWNEYVHRHPHAHAYHLGQWAAILGATYGTRARYLAVEDGGALRGVLPLVHSRGLVLGSRLRSLPAVRIAGPLGASIEDEVELLLAARAVAAELEARELVFHARRDGYTELVPGLEERNKHPAWITPAAVRSGGVASRVEQAFEEPQSQPQRAEKAGLVVREGGSDADLRSFYRLYLATMKSHHSLPRPYRQLKLSRDLLAPLGVLRLLVVEKEGHVVAGGVFYEFNGTLELHLNARDAAALELRPNHALYWHAIRWAIDRGLQRFDWGEARPGSTLERLKSQWSANPVAEHCYHWVRHSRARRAGTRAPWATSGARAAAIEGGRSSPAHGTARRCCSPGWPTCSLTEFCERSWRSRRPGGGQAKAATKKSGGIARAKPHRTRAPSA